MKEFFIPLNVPSCKNSKRWTGKILISSKLVMDYRKNTALFFKKDASLFRAWCKGLPKPLRIGFHFVRKSKRKYDWVNPLQTTLDDMVSHGWIDDDSVFEVIPFPYLRNGAYSTVDTKNPGVYIKILF